MSKNNIKNLLIKKIKENLNKKEESYIIYSIDENENDSSSSNSSDSDSEYLLDYNDLNVKRFLSPLGLNRLETYNDYIIERYYKYFKHRSNCNRFDIIFSSNGRDLLNLNDYYKIIEHNKDLFFIITIENTTIVYYWKENYSYNGYIFNLYNDDGQYIKEYNDFANNKIVNYNDDYMNKKRKYCTFTSLLNDKGIQTCVILKGDLMKMPDPFYIEDKSELKLTGFPNTLLEGIPKINKFSNDYFEIENSNNLGILTKLIIGKNENIISLGGLTNTFKCDFTILKGRNDI